MSNSEKPDISGQKSGRKSGPKSDVKSAIRPAPRSAPPKSVPGSGAVQGPSTGRVLGIGLELGFVIGGVTYLGYLADGYFETEPWLALVGALLGMTGGCANVIREVMGKSNK